MLDAVEVITSTYISSSAAAWPLTTSAADVTAQCCSASADGLMKNCPKMNSELSFDCAKYFGSVANLLDSSVVFVGCCSNLNRLT